MTKLTDSQYQTSADVAGNIATVWFAAGVISPLFVKPEASGQIIISILAGLVMTICFALIAITLAKGVKND